MSETIGLDLHAHLIPVAEVSALDGIAWNGEKSVMTIDGATVGIRPIFRPDALLAWMDENAIAQTWISAPPPTYRQHLRGAEAAAWFEHLNTGLQRIAAEYPDRLKAFVHLPMETPDAAAALARLWIGRGHTRFSAPAGGEDGQIISDPAYNPLWQALSAAGALLLLHPGECPDKRLDTFYLSNLLGNPYETALAAAHLVFGGVIASFPDITFCLAHGGGVAGMLAGRWTQGFETDRPGLDKSLPPPKVLMRRLWVDCILHDDSALALAADIFGAEHVIFGSDWPFPMGLLHPHQQLARLIPAFRQTVLKGYPR